SVSGARAHERHVAVLKRQAPGVVDGSAERGTAATPDAAGTGAARVASGAAGGTDATLAARGGAVAAASVAAVSAVAAGPPVAGVPAQHAAVADVVVLECDRPGCVDQQDTALCDPAESTARARLPRSPVTAVRARGTVQAGSAVYPVGAVGPVGAGR